MCTLERYCRGLVRIGKVVKDLVVGWCGLERCRCSFIRVGRMMQGFRASWIVDGGVLCGLGSRGCCRVLVRIRKVV